MTAKAPKGPEPRTRTWSVMVCGSQAVKVKLRSTGCTFVSRHDRARAVSADRKSVV